MGDYITTQEAAKLLGVSTRRVVAMIAKGRLQAKRFGGRVYLIERADLEKIGDRKPGRKPRGDKKDV